MEKKTKRTVITIIARLLIIKTLLILATLVVLALVINSFSYPQTPGEVIDNQDPNSSQELEVDLGSEQVIEGLDERIYGVPDNFDVDRIINEVTIDESIQSIIDNPKYSIPKNVADIEMMTHAQKVEMGLDVEMDYQILGRSEDGSISSYQPIISESSFILDL